MDCFLPPAVKADASIPLETNDYRHKLLISTFFWCKVEIMETNEEFWMEEFLEASLALMRAMADGKLSHREMQNLRATAETVRKSAEDKIQIIESRPEYVEYSSRAQEKFDHLGETSIGWQEAERARSAAYENRFPSVTVAKLKGEAL